MTHLIRRPTRAERASIVGDRLSDVDLANDLDKPIGRYRVELMDRHTGRVIERVDTPNYITPVYARMTRWWQARSWYYGLRSAHDGTADIDFPEDVDPNRDYLRPPIFPVECMIGSDSSAAEDTADSWYLGRTIGWGARWKANVSASGKRGQINEAQSRLETTFSRYVWDFNENQGNGDYGSLYIGRVAKASDALGEGVGCNPIAAPIHLIDDPYDTVSGRILGLRIGGIDDTNIYGLVQYTNSVTAIRIEVYPRSGLTLAGSGGSTLKAPEPAPTEITLDGTFIARNGGQAGDGQYNINTGLRIVPYAGGYLIGYSDGKSHLRLRLHNAAGVKQWDIEVANTGTSTNRNGGHVGLAVIGTNAYLCTAEDFGNLRDSIYRVDLTTQTVTATLPIGTGNYAISGGLTTDGTDLFVSTREGVQCIQTDGTYVESYGLFQSDEWTEAGLSPWSTGTQRLGMPSGLSDGLRLYLRSTSEDRVSGDLGVEHWLPYGQTRLGMGADSNGLYVWRSDTNPCLLYPWGQGGAFSRAVLDSIVTKTTSSTMKWTYELTFPSSFIAELARSLPPKA